MALSVCPSNQRNGIMKFCLLNTSEPILKKILNKELSLVGYWLTARRGITLSLASYGKLIASVTLYRQNY